MMSEEKENSPRVCENWAGRTGVSLSTELCRSSFLNWQSYQPREPEGRAGLLVPFFNKSLSYDSRIYRLLYRRRISDL